MKKIILIIAMFTCIASAYSQSLSPTEYIEQYKDLAIQEMKRMGIPAAITLAQGLLETENGNSDLLKKSNNHFGIKCKSNWTGLGVTHDDDAKGECFRSYNDAAESYRDHSNFLRSNQRYAFLFKLDPTDYKGWCDGLKKAGYATNPKYPNILIKHIELYNLQQYSLAAAEDVPVFETEKYQDDKEVPFIYIEDSISTLTETNNGFDVTLAAEKASFINGTKCILGKKGTSLLAIATKNNIQLGRLLEYNDFDNDGLLQKDQIIFLQKKQATGIVAFYITGNNETALDVAQKNGMQLSSLVNFNKIDERVMLPVGTKLYLQSAKPSTAPSEEIALIKKTHEVQPKEGLYSISKKYQVTVKQLKDWNNLVSDNLSIGQQLIVAE